MDRQTALGFIQGHEGRRNSVYNDSEGIPTIGVGFNLQKAGAQQSIEALGVDYSQLLAGTVSLTDPQIDTLFNADLDTAMADAAQRVQGFWNLPDNAQLAVVDMVFNLGGPRFSGFVNFIAALSATPPDYLTAAVQMGDSQWARQVPNRAADDIALVRGCAT